jgi:pimeloyl-ACP methyl ester carboxylesterase
VKLALGESAIRAGLGALGYRSRDMRGVRLIEAEGRGDLPPIVLLHGLGSRAADYLPLLQRLRPHVRRVVAPDFPGHGASPRPEPFDIGTSTRALVDALAEAVDPAVVYGNSLGGFSAIRFASLRPERVLGIFIASPAGAPSSADDFTRFQATLRVDTHGDAVRFLEKVIDIDSAPARHALAWLMRRRLAPVRPLVDDMPRAPGLTSEEVASLAMPVHLFWGKNEGLLPVEHLEFFRTTLRDATIEEPAGFGHSPHTDDVDAIARKLIDFARSIKPRR